MRLEPGDIIETKKPHPCGSKEFEILRKGADIKMLCQGCGKEIWVERIKLERRIRKVNGQRPE
ncbi:MAG: DUF951 domain-containing protein [Tissierellia bacterium]|nr:DUF951 domain-containing protein [Tissierellia bacterium]